MVRKVRRSSASWQAIFPEIQEIDKSAMIGLGTDLAPIQFLQGNDQEWSETVQITLNIHLTGWSEESDYRPEAPLKIVQLLQGRQGRSFNFFLVAVAHCEEVRHLEGESARADDIKRFSVESFRIPVQGTVTDLKCSATNTQVTFGCSLARKAESS